MELTSELAPVEPSLPAGTTRADFCIGQFCVEADVTTGDRRLLEVLRDNTRQYLDIRRVTIRPADSPEARADYPDGLLNKAEIEWAAVRAEPSRSEGRLYGFVRKTPVRVALVLSSYRLEGNLFLDTAGTDPVLYFLRGVDKPADRFLAVNSATIASSTGAFDEAGLVIINRNAVRVFSVIR